MTGLSGALAKYEFHRSVKVGPISFNSSGVGRDLIPASIALSSTEWSEVEVNLVICA